MPQTTEGRKYQSNLMGAQLSLGCDSVSTSGMKLVEFMLCASVLVFLRYISSQRKYVFCVIEMSWLDDVNYSMKEYQKP